MNGIYRFARFGVPIGLLLCSIFTLVLSPTLTVSAARHPLITKQAGADSRAGDFSAFPKFIERRDTARRFAANAKNMPRTSVTDIGPEFGISYSAAGFVFRRENPRQMLLPTGTRIFRSTNGGLSWSTADIVTAEGFSDGSFFVRQDPGNSQVLFAVSGAFSFGQSLYRSEDFGSSWARIEAGFPTVADCAINEASSNGVLVLTQFAEDEALWRSIDGGMTFEPLVGSGLPKLLIDPDTEEVFASPFYTNIATTPVDPDIVYVVQNGDEVGYYPPSIYKSVDGGETFARLEGGPPQPLQVFPHPTQPNVLFVQDSADTNSPGIYRSVDGGASFQAAATGLPANEFNFFVAFDANNPSFVYVAGEGGFFRSTNGGETFQPLGLTADQLGLGASTASVDPSDPNIIYVNTNRGNFKSVNGGITFTPINNGWKAAGANHIAFDKAKEPTLYVTAPSGIGILRTRGRGNSYEQVPHPAGPGDLLNGAVWPSLLAVAPSNPSMILAGTRRGGMFRTADGGRSWTPASIDTGHNQFSSTSSEIAFDPLNPNNVYFVTSSFPFEGFYRSTNNGSSFQRTNIDLDISNRFSDLGIDPINPSVIYTGPGPTSAMNFGPIRSVDGGLNFASGPLFVSSIRDVEIDPMNSNNVYLGGRFFLTDGSTQSHSMVRSTDGGATYTAADAGLPAGIFFIGVVIDPQNPARLYAWTRMGLFMTVDRGTTWTLLEGNETVKAAGFGTAIAINPSHPNRLYLAGATILEVEVRE